jgi:F-type H+-transporting ATPase subunit delta
MSVARSYAGALYAALQAEQADEAVLKKSEQDLEVFSAEVAAHPQLRVILCGPSAAPAEKQAVLEALKTRAAWSPVLYRFISLVTTKGRMGLISEIAAAFKRVRIESSGGTLGVLESAEPLSDTDIHQLSAAFSKKLGVTVDFERKTRPELLAGVRVTVGGTTYDGTLKAQLGRLRDKFFGNHSLTH